MLISGIVAGLILISTASTISEIQSQEFNPDFSQNKISSIKEEARDLDFEEENDRRQFRNLVNSLPGYSSDLRYWESKECFNVTLRRRSDIYNIKCLGKELQVFDSIILELLDKSDFDNSGIYHGTSAGISDNSGNLGIGYLNGNNGDNLVGFWRLDRIATTASSSDSFNNYWTKGNSPDINVKKVDTNLDLESSGSTEVTVNVSKIGTEPWKIDVSLYNYSTSSISWTQNEIYEAEGPIENIIPADIDRDTETELVWVDENSEEVEFADRDSGSWTVNPIGNQDGESVSVADIDNDGDLDVVGGGNGNYLYWWDNTDGDGSSWDQSTIGSKGTIRSIAVGDVTGDGLVDVVTSGYSYDVTLYENDGSNGNWPTTTVGSGTRWTVALADLDSDSDLDIISGDDDGSVNWWENDNGDGSSWNGREISNEDSDIFTIAVEDVDNDGTLDVFAGEGDGDIRLYRNTDGDGQTWQDSKIGESSSSIGVRALQTGDMDMDGNVDIIAGMNAGDSEPNYFENDGTYSGWNRDVLSDNGDGGHYGIAVVDIDEDGILEMVSGEDGSPSSVRIWNINGISSNLIGSKKIEFSSSTSKTVNFNWIPDQVSENLVIEANPVRNFTETLETSDETSGSINNRVIQLVTPSETVFDYSGEGNDAKPVNFDGGERGSEGVFSTDGVRFEGGNEKIVHDSLLGYPQEFTLAAWVKVEGMPDSSDWADFIAIGDYVLISNRESGFYGVSGFYHYEGGWRETNYPESIRGRGWRHVAYTHNGTHQKLYLNGTVVAKTNYDDEVLWDGTLGNRTAIGGNGYFSDRDLRGNMDEAMFYNRALSEKEVEKLHFYGEPTKNTDFKANYSSIERNLEEGQTVEKVYINSSVPADTSAKVFLNHSSGSPDTVDLPRGVNHQNYSVSIPSGGTAEVNIHMSSDSQDMTLIESPVIRELRLWSNDLN